MSVRMSGKSKKKKGKKKKKPESESDHAGDDPEYQPDHEDSDQEEVASDEDDEENQPMTTKAFRSLEAEQSEAARDTREKGIKITLAPHPQPKLEIKDNESEKASGGKGKRKSRDEEVKIEKDIPKKARRKIPRKDDKDPKPRPVEPISIGTFLFCPSLL